MSSLRIVAISDTHNRHEEMVELPDGDVLIHAGDATVRGSESEVSRFLLWFNHQPHRWKLLVAGNHDFLFQESPQRARELLGSRMFGGHVTYLQDAAFMIAGVKFYGSPWTPTFFDWAFMLPRGPHLAERWSLIPDDTDVLITHGPAAGSLDFSRNGDVKAGCEDLSRRVGELTLKAHVFGHIHHSYGIVERRRGRDGHPLIIANASICDEAYRPKRAPLVFDVETGGTDAGEE